MITLKGALQILNRLDNSCIGKNIKYAIVLCLFVLSILPAVDLGLYVLLKPSGFWQGIVFFLVSAYFAVIEIGLFCLSTALLLKVSAKRKKELKNGSLLS